MLSELGLKYTEMLNRAHHCVKPLLHMNVIDCY